MPRLLTYLFAALLFLPSSLLAQSTAVPQAAPNHDGQRDPDGGKTWEANWIATFTRPNT
jgi:hypothetical protein